MIMSKLFHETVGKGISSLREKVAEVKLRNLEVGEHFLPFYPIYISQLADAENKSIKKAYGKIEDKVAAKKFGAVNLKDFSYWAWRSCGIVGTQMVLKTVIGDLFNKTTMDLINEGLEFCGYNVVKDVGWYHSALIKLVEKYRISAKSKKFISSAEIALLLHSGICLLVSVKSSRGGHMLLFFGFRLNKNKKLDGFWYHDPYNFKRNGENLFISIDDLNRRSTRRIILFKN